MKKIKLHIPVAQYGFFEVEVPENEAIETYNKYAEKPLIPHNGKWKKIETFTNEIVFFNEETHQYKAKDGTPLLSGSAYAEKFEREFDLDKISDAVAKKEKISQEQIKDMWARNGEISRTFGTALHLAMEQWFLHKNNGGSKDYHLPKHPFLRQAVESFPLNESNIKPEIVVSNVSEGLVGTIDGYDPDNGIIIDYKSDANVKKNLDKHQRQLSFYAYILKSMGYKVDKIQIWNYTDKWESYDLNIEQVYLDEA